MTGNSDKHSYGTLKALRDAIIACTASADRMFGELAGIGADNPGITRDAYGEGENAAHKWFAGQANALGLETTADFALNSYATWKAEPPRGKRILIGSHLDSVKHGGNFDGAAGVVAGLVVVEALQKLGYKPVVDITVMGVRAEESAWFQHSYIGSRAALGMLAEAALAKPRIDNGRSLASHMEACGADVTRIRAGERHLDPNDIQQFLELHIEQAPSLDYSNTSVGICTAIPGNFRYSSVKVIGELGHVGTPKRYRRDAMLAASAFATRVEAMWSAHEAEGKPMACTFGRFYTDAETQSLTNVCGLFFFSMDVRAYDADHLAELERRILEIARKVEEQYRVSFDFGERASAPVGVVDPDIGAGLLMAAQKQSVSHVLIGSPASHDAAAFAAAGVPFGMVFVRNQNGSHNPREAMRTQDFIEGVCVIAQWLADCGAVSGR